METFDNKENKKNGQKNCQNEIYKQVTTKPIQWPENITEIDLVSQDLSADVLESTIFPPNLISLNLSRNKLGYVPTYLLNLSCLKNLDLSFNSIEYFDDSPSFSKTIEKLSLEKNNLHGPPYWVWTEKLEKLSYLNIRHNINLTKSLTDDYLAELLTYKTPVKHLIIDNCKLQNHLILLQTFVEIKELDIGNNAMSYRSINAVEKFPCAGLDKCLTIGRINLSNTQIFLINSNIDIYNNLEEIDLSFNSLSSLPNEFCSLKRLRVFILSHNKLLYLPDRFTELVKLACLHLDNNELCILPSLTQLVELQLLDLYNNSLSELPDGIENVSELDLAQNYFEEPTETEYGRKKGKLRAKVLNFEERIDGNKNYVEPAESEHSQSEFTDDDDIAFSVNSYCDETHRPPSSIEDWDSDDYWIPYPLPRQDPPQSPWINFIHRKMKEGNFCPMDLHTVPVYEQVKYEKLCYPKVVVEIPGQFDDLTDDDS